MKYYALILALFALPLYALDHSDVEQPDDEGHGLTAPNLFRTLASGSNYYVNVSHHMGDFYIENLGFGNTSMNLIVITPSGGYFTKFIKMAPGQIRTISGDVLEGGSEFYLISLQNFRVHLTQPKRGLIANRQSVAAVPPRTALPLVRVTAPNGAEVTVGVDSDDNVHYIVFGNIIGKWDHQLQAVSLSNGTILPKQD